MIVTFIKAKTKDDVLFSTTMRCRVEKGDVVQGPLGETWDVQCVKWVLMDLNSNRGEYEMTQSVWVTERKTR